MTELGTSPFKSVKVSMTEELAVEMTRAAQFEVVAKRMVAVGGVKVLDDEVAMVAGRPEGADALA
jgi:hypothetical protein